MKKLHILHESESKCVTIATKRLVQWETTYLRPYDMVCYLNIKYKWKAVRAGGRPFIVAQRYRHQLKPGVIIFTPLTYSQA